MYDENHVENISTDNKTGEGYAAKSVNRGTAFCCLLYVQHVVLFCCR